MFEDVKETYSEEDKGKYHYYYDRQKRLENAPQSVKDFYAGKMKPPSAFKALFGNKTNRFVLISLVFFLGVTWLYTGLNGTRKSARIDNVNLELQAFAFEEQIFASLKLKDTQKKDKAPAESKKVTAEFFIIDADNQISNKSTESVVYTGGEEYLRTKATDYDIIRVDVIVNIDGEEKELSAKVKR